MRFLVSSVSGSQPTGRGPRTFEFFYIFFFQANELLLKCNHLRHAATFNSHYMSSFNLSFDA
ncbi:MAG: hypothetical protein PV344_03640 [Anaplasma sp.]|nr:hypothetical protein [Anaplasma sp.]